MPYQVQTVFNNMVNSNDDGHILSYTLRTVFRIPVASFRMRIARLLPENRGAKETVSYITVVAWQDLAQKVSRDGKNGQGVAVEGFLHSRTFSTTRNERRTAIEVYADSLQLVPVFLEPAAEVGPTRGPEPRARDSRGPGRGPRGPRRGGDGRAEERGAEAPAADPTLPFASEGFAPDHGDRPGPPVDGGIDESHGHYGEGEGSAPH